MFSSTSEGVKKVKRSDFSVFDFLSGPTEQTKVTSQVKDGSEVKKEPEVKAIEAPPQKQPERSKIY